MQASELLLSELDDDGILRLTLNDAGRRNALSEAMLGQVGVAFARAVTDPSVRVIILAAAGPTFCAQREMTLSEAYDYASGVMVDNMLIRDAEEGISAFIEKRRPRWQDS